ncbi:hypothetical protein [Dactylosporangium sp. CA-139066]|uniref:hypothetical protein n=1 Tax=Dactylosporangium sp. CA-139066 TaxID=3239930 RepID=UPI003D8DCE35
MFEPRTATSGWPPADGPASVSGQGGWTPEGRAPSAGQGGWTPEGPAAPMGHGGWTPEGPAKPAGHGGWTPEGPEGPPAGYAAPEPDGPPPWWREATGENTGAGAHRSDGRHLHAVPPAGATPAAPAARPSHDITPTFRGAVVARLRRFSFLHARHAWERRRSDPLAAHGIALFYHEPRAKLFDQLRTATRIFLADDEAASLPHLLFGLAQHAREGYTADPGFDPRHQMANRVDEMSPYAVFAGVGVVTLDTPYGAWSDVQRRARGEQDVPGRCYARLIDGTMLLVDRGGEPQFNILTVECSIRDGNTQYGTPSMHWKWNPALAETPETDPTFHVWRWMGELGRVIDHGTQPR